MSVEELLERYEVAWRSTRSYAGEGSQAGIYMGEQYLAALLAFDAPDARIAEVAEAVNAAAFATTPKPPPVDDSHVRSYGTHDGRPTISYATDVFDGFYRPRLAEVPSEERVLLRDGATVTARLTPGGTHPFVVRPDGEALAWASAMDPGDIMAGRTAASLGHFTHPMLAHPDLEIVCAGEATFGFDGDRYGGVVINNRSGHYRPGKHHLESAAELLEHQLGGRVVTVQYFGASDRWITG